MNRKIIVVAFGSLGDIYPLLAVAEILSKHHQVAYLANDYFREHVVNRGIEFQSIGTLEDQLSAKESESSSGETKHGRRHRFQKIIGNSFKKTYDYIESQVALGLDIIVVTHGNLSPATIACEKFNLPLIITYYATSQIPHNTYDMDMYNEFHGRDSWLRKMAINPWEKFLRTFSFEVKDELNSYRKQYGLPPLPSGIRRIASRIIPQHKNRGPGVKVHRHIALLPDWFCEPINRHFPHMDFVGFPFINEIDDNTPELADFLEKHPNPIVFTPGTAVEDIKNLCQEIIPICRKVNSPGILVAKHGRAEFEKLSIPVDVPLHYVEHANFETLLPKSRCIVHHGGIGTVAQAIRAGIPQIIRPRMYDQPINGLRVMMCGLGGSIPASEFNVDLFANILLHIESSDLHKERISYYSNQVKIQNGAKGCVNAILKFIDDKDLADDAFSSNLAAHQLQ